LIKSAKFKDILKYPPIITQIITTFAAQPHQQAIDIKLIFKESISTIQEEILQDPELTISLKLFRTVRNVVNYSFYGVGVHSDYEDSNTTFGEALIKTASSSSYILNIPNGVSDTILQNNEKNLNEDKLLQEINNIIRK
jgi:hypothetical protein